MGVQFDVCKCIVHAVASVESVLSTVVCVVNEYILANVGSGLDHEVNFAGISVAVKV